MPQRLSFVWDSDSLDWKDLSATDITKRVTSKVQPGSIVLFHNAAKNTPEALPSIIEYLLKEGYAPTRECVRAAVQKVIGNSEFTGQCDETVWCGRWDTKY